MAKRTNRPVETWGLSFDGWRLDAALPEANDLSDDERRVIGAINAALAVSAEIRMIEAWSSRSWTRRAVRRSFTWAALSISAKSPRRRERTILLKEMEKAAGEAHQHRLKSTAEMFKLLPAPEGKPYDADVDLLLGK